MMQGRHPVAVIDIMIPTGDVDINIHPTKTEVKFQNERKVFSAVQKSVRQALISQAPVPGIEDVAAIYTAPSPTGQSSLAPTWAELGSTDSIPITRTTPAFSLPALRLLGQLNGSYIIAEGPDGLYIIDQHAAHERILFDKFSQQKSSQQVEVQGLLEPVTLEVSPRQDEVLKSCYENLSDFGFSIEPFGDRAYLVRTVPALIHRKDWMGILRELLDSPPEGGNADWSEKLTVSMACHGAIKAGQALTNDEMREMIRQLEQTALPNTCPHGRPTMIHLSSGQLEKEFQRT
jgi:DNA mismatch repair protein MutL